MKSSPKKSVIFIMLASSLIPTLASAETGNFLDDISKLEVTKSTDTLQPEKVQSQNKVIKEDVNNILTRKNVELTAAAADAQKKLDDTTRTLSAEIASLKQQSTKQQSGQKEQKESASALSRKNAELTAAAADAQKKLDDTTRTLSAEIASLKQQGAEQQKPLTKLDLKNKNDVNSYSLGAFFLDQALMDVMGIKSSEVKISEPLLILGFNDAYNNQLKMSTAEIRKNIDEVNKKITSNANKVNDLLKKKIENKDFKILPSGAYLIIEKKGSKPYTNGKSVSFNSLEKHFDGKPIMNSMNTSVIYDDKSDSLIAKAINFGKKGGRVTLYAKASSLYNEVPKGVKAEEMVSITFELL